MRIFLRKPLKLREELEAKDVMFDDFRSGMTERLDTESVSTDEKYKQIQRKMETGNTEVNERMREMREELEAKDVINEQMNKILDDLRANQQKLETKNHALSQTVLEMQIELTNVKASLPCDAGWRHFNGHCYLIEKVKKTWDDASAFCENRTSYLIEIKTDAEFDFVVELTLSYGGSTGFWIGATDRHKEGTFVYQHSNQQVPDKYWAPFESKFIRTDENCVTLSRFHGDLELFDIPCSLERNFVCKRHLFIYDGTV